MSGLGDKVGPGLFAPDPKGKVISPFHFAMIAEDSTSNKLPFSPTLYLFNNSDTISSR